ncbi:Glutaredoxin family protein [Striga hermonthica]|uniref:Glutaredoxin family protein n=1 Tax=Striga hermonthica TaxID=68872 RepID=A0A9N7N840_STRHE|nr:Glutaredoxin family protein [Striga hermonthica]
MWLRRSETRAQVNNASAASAAKFACSSFKDVRSLFSPDDFTGAAGRDGCTVPSICHRNRSAKALLRSLSLSHTALLPDGEAAAEIRIPSAEESIVIYFTSLRVVRRTFEDCKAVRTILRAFRVPVDEPSFKDLD